MAGGSRVRVEQDLPSERVPGGEVQQFVPGKFAAGQASPPTPIVPGVAKTGSILFVVGVGSVTHVSSGNPITLKDLASVNPAFTDIIYSYPGGAADKNDSQWLKAAPKDVAAVPNWRIRVHWLGEA